MTLFLSKTQALCWILTAGMYGGNTQGEKQCEPDPPKLLSFSFLIQKQGNSSSLIGLLELSES